MRPLINWSCRLLGLPSLNELEANLLSETTKIEQMKQQQNALYRVISKIRASLDIDYIFRTTTKETCKLLGAERVAVYRFYEDWGGEFVSDFEFAEPGWIDHESLGKNTVWIDTYLQKNQGGRYKENQTLVVSDVLKAELSQCHLDVLQQFGIQAYATVPIFTKQKLWGVLAAYQHSNPREWQDSEVEFLAQVATQLGFAVQQAELLAQSERKAKDLQETSEQQQILLTVIAAIRESLDLDILFKTTAREVLRALNADRVGIFRFDPETNYCSGQFVSESVLPIYDSALITPINDRCFGEKYALDYQQGRMQVLNNIYEYGLKDCHLKILEKFQIQAQIVSPLMKGKILWGLLCIHQCDRPRQWTKTELQFVKQLAAQFSIALSHSDLLVQTRSQAEQLNLTLKELKTANLKLEKLARRDGLTGIANRRYFNAFFNKTWETAKDNHQYLSLILFDVDYFKLYNDFYGHPAGDQCLISITRSVQKILRSTDLLARYGGEEFAVILPNTNPDQAYRVADKIQAVVRNLTISHTNIPTGKSIVTVSLGVSSQIPRSDLLPQDLINEADQALYSAKKQGRDQWVSWAQPLSVIGYQ
ncbi:putative Diguanylate cyclase [Planktothrix sp. PCC 11201]|uniref:sensor domain-containing diguanylate cyclase n=1 Tax=Planktothrix sp. PCC 11201 TaxID=1729650 RepID=UPI000915B8FA|nr:diguanylate cyclase [Planktothrix sp. PCC 11201]SKB15282.1 putative Diguanylate cyclase [Planktothrix sp. PCC 11201]